MPIPTQNRVLAFVQKELISEASADDCWGGSTSALEGLHGFFNRTSCPKSGDFPASYSTRIDLAIIGWQHGSMAAGLKAVLERLGLQQVVNMDLWLSFARDSSVRPRSTRRKRRKEKAGDLPDVFYIGKRRIVRDDMAT